MECRDCGDELHKNHALFVDSNGNRTDKPTCNRCHELSIIRETRLNDPPPQTKHERMHF